MRYLPILQELFESDSVWFFIIGAAIAAVPLLRCKSVKVGAVSLAASAVIYALCEFIAGRPGTYMAEFIALILGTAALGAAAAGLVSLIVCLTKERKKT